MNGKTAALLTVRGIVQGVGFRPFLLRTARSLGLSGYVVNTPDGVEAVVEGESTAVDSFEELIRTSAPPMARVESVNRTGVPLSGFDGFVIRESVGGEVQTFVSPDIGVCEACLEEINNPADRRFGYAFTNCTDCGPRFSIIESVPYDRPGTTMSGFKMCAECGKEYTDPFDRRFHAQPVACADCGPSLSFTDGESSFSDRPLERFAELLSRGGIGALKGLGGFHLVCRACDDAAVETLRKRKHREAKALAVMLDSLEKAEEYCFVSEEEKKQLLSYQRPIVLLRRKSNCPVSRLVAPESERLGVMLPYTPLHALLMKHFEALVMTSGNYTDEPMLFEGGSEKVLLNIADGVLTHNRRIFRRVDDSVTAEMAGGQVLLRRARGFAPAPVRLPGGEGCVLALGAQQKNTFCLTKGEFAFLSSHIGDLDNPTTEKSFKDEIKSFINLFDGRPELAVRDKHPDYYSSAYAGELSVPVLEVQHHHAHFASVLAEHGLTESLCAGFVFDGTGFGDDGTLWGGELLAGSVSTVTRAGHLLLFRLPGGEAAVREPLRLAAYLCREAAPELELTFGESNAERLERSVIAAQKGINSPFCSSMGRLFDAVAVIAGLCETVSYEGQAAVMLEQAADMTETGCYGFDIFEKDGVLIFDWRPVIRAALEDRLSGDCAGKIAARFHRGVIALVKNAAQLYGEKNGVNRVALSGGCFQNFILTNGCFEALSSSGFEVLINRKVPANDGGISYGQAAVAAALNKRG